MELKIIKNQAVKISLHKVKVNEELVENTFSIDFKTMYHLDRNDMFTIVFEVSVKHPNIFHLEVEYFTSFVTSEPIDASFKESHIPSVNAPAIAFPFLRSLVANITLNAGYQAALLPSINFEKINSK